MSDSIKAHHEHLQEIAQICVRLEELKEPGIQLINMYKHAGIIADENRWTRAEYKAIKKIQDCIRVTLQELCNYQGSSHDFTEALDGFYTSHQAAMP